MSWSVKRGLTIGVAAFLIAIVVRLVFDQLKDRDFDPWMVFGWSAIFAIILGVIAASKKTRQQ